MADVFHYRSDKRTSLSKLKALWDAEDEKDALSRARYIALDIMRDIEEISTDQALNVIAADINGSVKEFCKAAADSAGELGYEPVFLTDQLSCEAREAGSFLASILKSHAGRCVDMISLQRMYNSISYCYSHCRRRKT